MGILGHAAKQVQATRDDDLSFVRSVIRRIRAKPGGPYIDRALRDWLAEQQAQTDLFTVVIYGRTKAGKSTLAEALTGGDGQSMGNGRQRTTKTPRAYREGNVRLVDAPGVGAHDGQPDAKLARSQLQQADVVVFVVTDDGLPAAVFDELALVRQSGTPALFVLNIKDDIEPIVDRVLWSDDPVGCFAERDVADLRSDIEEQARERLGIPEPRVIHLHALAALEASRGDPGLAGAGRLDELAEMIAQEARDHAAARRSRSVLDGAAHRLAVTASDVRTTLSNVDAELKVFEISLSELSERLKQCAQEFPASIRKGVVDQFMELDRGLGTWLDRNVDAKPAELQAAWERRVAATDLPGRLATLQQDAIDRIKEIVETSAGDLTEDLSQLAELPLTVELQPFRTGADWHQAARIAKFLTLALPAATMLPVVSVPLGVAALVAGIFATVFAALQRRLPDAGQRRRRHIGRVRWEVRRELERAANEAADTMIPPLVKQTGCLDHSSGWDASTAAGEYAQGVESGLAALQKQHDLLSGMLDLLHDAQRAVDTRLIERLSEAVTQDPARVELVERQRGRRTTLRGRLNPDEHRRFVWLLDEDITLVGECDTTEVADTGPQHAEVDA